MLQSDWDHCPAAPPGAAKPRTGAGCGWKGRTAAMGTLLKHHIMHHGQPLDLLLQLAESLTAPTLSDSEYAGDFLPTAQDFMQHSGYCASSSANNGGHDSCTVYRAWITVQKTLYSCAALTPSSLGTWYKALFETLLLKWESIAKCLNSSSAAVGVDGSVAEACQCAKIFAALMQVTKTHTDKQVGD